MICRIARVSFVISIVLSLVVPLPFAVACGPDFTLPTYTDFSHPESQGFAYERGQLGLLQRGYWHIHLYEAYRNLSGRPFSNAELKALKDRQQWADSQAETQVQNTSGKTKEDWIATWRSIRAEALGSLVGTRQPLYDATGITRMESHDNRFLFYYNCLEDAFQAAVHIANERQKQFGAQSPVFKEWVAAQDQVFENCSAGVGYPPQPKTAVIPVASRVEDPQVIRADRAYQIAAAHFYAGEFDAAQTAFERIANDPTSPYRTIAPYLVARTLIRKATLGSDEDDYDADTLADAERQLGAVLASKDSAEFHPAALHLLGFVRIRLHPVERLHELETALLSSKPSPSWGQDLTDYLWLLDHPALIRPSAASPGSTVALTAAVQDRALAVSDTSDWIITFQQNGDSAFQHSFQRWHETNSLPWLVAAITKVDPAHTAAAAELSAAASKIAPESPAFLTVAFHRIRLREQSGQSEKARLELDALLTKYSTGMPISAQNQFRALRMKLAVDLMEFLQFAPRLSVEAASIAPPAAGGYKPGTPEFAAAQPHFDSDASIVLTEKLPLRTLADASKSNILPPDLRRTLMVAAWTRSILLQDETTARELAPLLVDLIPEVKPDLTNYLSSPERQHREFAALFTILRNPGFRPFVSAAPGRGWFYSVGESGFDKLDNFHDNWWCSFAPTAKDENWGWDFYRMFKDLREPLKVIYPDGTISEPAFVRDEEKAEAHAEQATLAALPSGPHWFGKLAVEWANAHPEDVRVPEALHLVVRAWRYGCTESSGENYSKQAFQLLHKRYPQSEWATKTPYWFN